MKNNNEFSSYKNYIKHIIFRKMTMINQKMHLSICHFIRLYKNKYVILIQNDDFFINKKILYV
jgi:hypothetical protein